MTLFLYYTYKYFYIAYYYLHLLYIYFIFGLFTSLTVSVNRLNLFWSQNESNKRQLF